MNTGQHDLTFADYHALDAWGSGALKAMRRGPPARVIWERGRGEWDTDATILGSAVHCALLTPDLYTLQYAIKPEGMTFSTKEGKAWRDDPARAGLTPLSFDTGAQVDAIVNALMDKTAVAKSLDNASARECSLLWDCSITGERCKARPDWIEGKWIYDLKVSRYAGGNMTYRAFADGWLHQSAHYRTGAVELGLPISGGRLVVVDPVAPHFVYTVEIKPDALGTLEWENIETLKALHECRVTSSFPGTPDEWKKIDMPAAALAQVGDQFEAEEEETAEAV